MPMYEYRCLDCETPFERLVFKQSDQVRCKKCESPRVEQVFSVFSVGGDRTSSMPAEADPCGACGAPERGMCMKE
jgi:putative FmdB family regulatory protein